VIVNVSTAVERSDARRERGYRDFVEKRPDQVVVMRDGTQHEHDRSNNATS
jgi:hypothetical protein